MSFIDNEINNRIKNYLKINFKTTFNNLKLLNQFKLEDLNNRINNVRKDYNTETDNRLAFLREQALIAREQMNFYFGLICLPFAILTINFLLFYMKMYVGKNPIKIFINKIAN